MIRNRNDKDLENSGSFSYTYIMRGAYNVGKI